MKHYAFIFLTLFAVVQGADETEDTFIASEKFANQEIPVNLKIQVITTKISNNNTEEQKEEQEEKFESKEKREEEEQKYESKKDGEDAGEVTDKEINYNYKYKNEVESDSDRSEEDNYKKYRIANRYEDKYRYNDEYKDSDKYKDDDEYKYNDKYKYDDEYKYKDKYKYDDEYKDRDKYQNGDKYISDKVGDFECDDICGTDAWRAYFKFFEDQYQNYLDNLSRYGNWYINLYKQPDLYSGIYH